jgi:hypothetical protein
MLFCLVTERESVTRNRNMLAFTGHVRPVCPCSGNLFCPATEWNSVARNGNMSIPGGHVLVCPFSDRTNSVTRIVYKHLNYDDYITNICIYKIL